VNSLVKGGAANPEQRDQKPGCRVKVYLKKQIIKLLKAIAYNCGAASPAQQWNAARNLPFRITILSPPAIAIAEIN